MGVVEEAAAGKFVGGLKKPDWCDDETFAEIKKKFGEDGEVLSEKEVERLVKEKRLKLKSIVGD